MSDSEWALLFLTLSTVAAARSLRNLADWVAGDTKQKGRK